MGKFVLAYRGGSTPASEAEQQAVMTTWMNWFGTLGDAVVDGGAPFAASTTVAEDGSVAAGGSAALTGYSILGAADLDAASGLAKGCPILTSGGTVDVYEVHEMM